MTEGTGSIVGGVNRVYKLKEAPHDLTTAGGVSVKAGEKVVEAGGKIYAVAEYKQLLAGFVEQENQPRSPLNILRNWSPGHSVGIYNPQSGLTHYDPEPNTDKEYRIIQALPRSELDKLTSYLEDEHDYLTHRNFLKWVGRVRDGMLTDGMTAADREKARLAAEVVKATYQKIHEQMPWAKKLPCGHEILKHGPTIQRYELDLRNKPDQKSFGCAICGKEISRKDLIKVLQPEELK